MKEQALMKHFFCCAIRVLTVLAVGLAVTAVRANTSAAMLGETAYTAQCAACHGVHLGGAFGPSSKVSKAQFRKYVDEELTPRFPDGLTVLDGGRQWRGEENRAIREAAKVVLIVMPKSRSAQSRIDAARNAYKARFHQDAVVEVMPPACVAL